MIIRYKTKKLTPLGKNPERQRVTVAPCLEDLVLEERIEDNDATGRRRYFHGVAAALVVDAERSAVLGRPVEIQITDARERPRVAADAVGARWAIFPVPSPLALFCKL